MYETKVEPFRVGFDMSTEVNKSSEHIIGVTLVTQNFKEEIEKRRTRAKKFGINYDPVMDIEGISKEDYDERKKRAARFGKIETKATNFFWQHSSFLTSPLGCCYGLCS